MKAFLVVSLMSWALPTWAQNCPAGQYDPTIWKLNWEDDFSSSKVDLSKWQPYLGPNMYTGEIQLFTDRDENIRIEKNRLVFEARKENLAGFNYTSGKVRSRVSQKYGRFEVCASVPAIRGSWPAIWFLPEKETYGTGYWPDNGEIDLMENIGFKPDNDFMSIHTKNNNHAFSKSITFDLLMPGITGRFHLFALEWYGDKLVYLVDNKKYFEIPKKNNDWRDWPFDQDFFMLINLSIGGPWADQQGIADDMFPIQMQVESVKVYSLKN